MTPVRRAAPPFRHRLSNPLMPQKSNAANNAPVDLDAYAIPTNTNNIQSLPRYRRRRDPDAVQGGERSGRHDLPQEILMREYSDEIATSLR